MGRRVIITNDVHFLKASLQPDPAGTAFLILEENERSGRIREFLRHSANAGETRAENHVDENEFIKCFSAFLASENKRNASLPWWAMNFTNKNPLLSSLCKDIRDFLVGKRLIESAENGAVVIVTGRRLVGKTLEQWAGSHKRSVEMLIKGRISVKELASSWFSVLPYSMLKAFILILKARLSFSKEPERKYDYAIFTQFENSSFRVPDKFNDVYFGNLAEHIRKRGMSVITCGFAPYGLTPALKSGKKLSASRVYPFEYFLGVNSVFKCAVGVFKARMQIMAKRQNAKILGEDVSEFIKDEIRKAITTEQLFKNLSVYYAVKCFMKKVRIKKVLYPFENRAWEKMVLFGVKESGAKVSTAGYQHAALTPKHTNFIFEKGEAEYTPLPDSIISMGKVTAGLMADYFKVPNDKIRTGCALRQSIAPKPDAKAIDPKGDINILVALASNLDEYVRTINFLDEACLKNNYKIKLRPHPSIDLNRALKINKPKNLKFTIDKGAKLNDAITASDIIIYSSSTVAIEAIASGKPVICVDAGEYINTDPLFAFSLFKWDCKDPKDLCGVIENIVSLRGEDLRKKREAGVSYARDYFCLPDDESLKPFFEAV